MGDRCEKDKQMPKLMRVAPDVKGAGPPALGDAAHVHKGAHKIQGRGDENNVEDIDDLE